MYSGMAVRTALAIGITSYPSSQSQESRAASARTWWYVLRSGVASYKLQASVIENLVVVANQVLQVHLLPRNVSIFSHLQ